MKAVMVYMQRADSTEDVAQDGPSKVRTWRRTGRAKFLEGHDIHVLCESPSAWHLLDGYGLRLPGSALADTYWTAKDCVYLV